MVAVPPLTPVSTPLADTVAMPVAPLLHAPDGAASVSAVVTVGHTVNVPVIVPALGDGFTVTTAVAAAVPQLLVTV